MLASAADSNSDETVKSSGVFPTSGNCSSDVGDSFVDIDAEAAWAEAVAATRSADSAGSGVGGADVVNSGLRGHEDNGTGAGSIRDEPEAQAHVQSSRQLLAPTHRDAYAQKRMIFWHMLGTIALSLFNFSSRTSLLASLPGMRENPRKMASILSSWAAAIGIIEFLLNPTIGSLSDSVGRRPFMLASPIACVVLKSWVAVRPSILSLSCEKIVCDSLRTLSGSTMCAAALMDVLRGDEMAGAFGELYSWGGVSMVAAPFIAGMLPTSRGTFALSAVAATAQLGAELRLLQETLPAEKRKPFGGFVNPLGILRLFAAPQLAAVSLVAMLHSLCEPKNMADVSALMQMSAMRWSDRKRALFVSLLGFSFVLMGPVTEASMARLGTHRHTSLMHWLSVVQFWLRSKCTEFSTWAGLCVMMIAETRQNGVKALCAQMALARGIEKGEYTGLAANLRALMVFVAPIVWGRLFQRGLAASPARPGLPFLGAALCMVVAEALMRSVRASQ
eukprot:TRINITY_DN64161_c0_g1_i1.p1 TRINITY_DN64161_c0_g1~~TRINITY_DN64161_c0_g1_i1.p1  ORF type:complete len:504 (+),score=91.80 TRINITY_DN64161_c0_g1_i1:60-1571(+)